MSPLPTLTHPPLASSPMLPLLTPSPDRYGLLTDLYQLTMTACYCGEGLDQRPASFELLMRRLPDRYGYAIAMGLTQAIEYLQNLRFTPDQLDWLQSTGIFQHAPDRFWALLKEIPPTGTLFTGTVWALPEGTAVFPHEPLLRIEAPLWQAQLVETYLLNTLNYQTLIATRAARLRSLVGRDTQLLEFGTRRAFSPQASLWAARAALAAGFNATSNVLAAMHLGQSPSGTMAHALVMALAALEGSEDQAFAAFHHYFPGAPLLIDTYDTIAAVDRLVLRVQSGESIPAVRLDSGDLVTLSQYIRSRLPGTKILASGDLEEFEIDRLQTAGASLDGYGIGTKLVTGSPVNGVYKLVEIDGIPVMKESSGKITYPGRKQIFRSFAPVTSPPIEVPEEVLVPQFQSDRLGLMTELPEVGEIPLLEKVMEGGKWLKSPESIAEIAQRVQGTLTSLPAGLRCIHQPDEPPVYLSQDLEDLVKKTRKTGTLW